MNPLPFRLLLQLEAFAVGALDFSGIGFVGADHDAVQTAVVGVLTVVSTVADSAADALVGSAGAAAVGAIFHDVILLRELSWHSPWVV